MKGIGSILLLLITAYSPLSAQYYFTGEVKDLHGDKLQRVAIIVQSTGLIYQTGRYGDFEIISKKNDDSLTFAYNGYEQYTTAIKSTDFLKVTLKRLIPPSAPHRPRVSSLISWRNCDPYPEHAGDKSFGVVENPFLESQTPMAFTGNPNGISFCNVRRFLDMGTTVPAEAVKIEEMIGYFNFFYEEPLPAELFHCSSELVSCPWNKSHRLLFVNVSAKRGDMRQMPPTHLIFTIDASGSMDMPNKLPLIKAGMRLLVRNLRDIDTVSFVQYGANMSVLAGIPGSKKGDIIRAIEELHADGESPGDAALQLAYRIAHQQYIRNGINRVILITDGDICADKTAADNLQQLVEEESEGGVGLSCIGVGMKDSDNVELPALAKGGKGSFECIEDVRGGEKVLLKEFNENLLCVADSVSISAGFDSTLVGSYRLIGYDNRRDLLADTALRLEGSTISSAHAMTALFELVPRKDSIAIENIAKIKIDYRLPGKKAVRTFTYDCPNSPVPFGRADVQLRKAACIALFGMKLKYSDYSGGTSWQDLERMTRKTFEGNNYIDKEYINLVIKARGIYERKK
ncbi:MAG TPA: von Willebrand factor type A domain-containing protein [Puia sp.]|uniref:vWA domain-containing protein n=1 Tax=Puia sp. TaxID=2045100 RepID=UPI002C48317C|nr:von Willebrand factor type A domain-containing protein [Puia sp.]HVU96938.1 von Willebrand factor type A domain-containing protein [Puia sp.]